MARPELLAPPFGGDLPLPYRWLYAHGVTELRPWSFIETQASAIALRDEFLLETAAPNPSVVRDWIPFARHHAQDDFAGFVLDDGKPTGEVAVVHLTWKRSAEVPGFPGITTYRDGWDWIARCLMPDTHEWAELNHEDIPELIAELDDQAANGKRT